MTNLCALCGDPMPPGEQMFKYHGYSGPCPKPPLPKDTAARVQGVAVEPQAQSAAAPADGPDASNTESAALWHDLERQMAIATVEQVEAAERALSGK